jgi:hypothetical protein
MVCPKDLIQMHQKDKVGGGQSTDEYYETWELKECPACGRVVREQYSVQVLTAEQVENMKKAHEWGEDWRKSHPEEMALGQIKKAGETIKMVRSSLEKALDQV